MRAKLLDGAFLLRSRNKSLLKCWIHRNEKISNHNESCCWTVLSIWDQLLFSRHQAGLQRQSRLASSTWVPELVALFLSSEAEKRPGWFLLIRIWGWTRAQQQTLRGCWSSGGNQCLSGRRHPGVKNETNAIVLHFYVCYVQPLKKLLIRLYFFSPHFVTFQPHWTLGDGLNV